MGELRRAAPPVTTAGRQAGLDRRSEKTEGDATRPGQAARTVDQMHAKDDSPVCADHFAIRRGVVPAPAPVVLREPAQPAHGIAEVDVRAEVLQVVIAHHLPRVPHDAFACGNRSAR